MTLQALLDRMNEAHDHLVEAENDITALGDMPEFTLMHEHLDAILNIVVELVNTEADNRKENGV